MKSEPIHYDQFLNDIRSRIHRARTRAVLSANAEMILMYWDIGMMIYQKQRTEGWGASVIPRLSKDIRNELSDIKGFSERNIGYMIRFAREYPELGILQQPVAKSEFHKMKDSIEDNDTRSNVLPLVTGIPWGHNILLMEKVKDIQVRIWYMQAIIQNGWSRNVLELMISTDAYQRQGIKVSNFDSTLPQPQSDLIRQELKDPYIFDFLSLSDHYRERELETGLLYHLQQFLLELGQGFSFVGSQYHLSIGNEDFYIDLLFYHLKLRCFIVIELKKGDFKPEYAGKINFYCSAVDDLLRHKNDKPTIGLILCQKKNGVLAEYSLRDMKKPIGISEYELTKDLPLNLKSSLPTVEEIEAELSYTSNKT